MAALNLGFGIVGEILKGEDIEDTEYTPAAVTVSGTQNPWFEQEYDLRCPQGDPKKLRDNAESRLYTGDPRLAVFIDQPNPSKVNNVTITETSCRLPAADARKIRDAATTTAYAGVPELAEIVKDPNPSKVFNVVPPPLPTLYYGAAGPTSMSNWVIEGKVIAGAYPGHSDLSQHTTIVNNVIAAGVDVFINLLEANEQKTMRPYKGLAAKVKYQKDGGNISVINLPISALGAPEPLNKHHEIQLLKQLDTPIAQLVRVILQLIDSGKVVYIHDLGGHGRTSVVSAVLIAIFYGVTSHDALKIIELSHGKRASFGNWKHSLAFHMPSQHDQVHRIVRTLSTLAPTEEKKEYVREGPIIEVPVPKTGRVILQPPGGVSSIQFGSLMTSNPVRDHEKHGFAVLNPPGGKDSLVISDSVPTTPITNEQKLKTRAILKPPGGDSSKIFG